MPTRVIVVASTTLYREAWCALLAQLPDIVVAGALVDLSAIADYHLSEQETSVLIDFPQPNTSFAQHLRALIPATGLLFLVHSYELDGILALLKAGATGCIARDASVEALTQALIATGRGEIALPPDIATRALVSLARGNIPVENHLEVLSEREIEVLGLLARGYTNRDIAQELTVSTRTIESHLRSILAKLKVRTRTEAALWANQHLIFDRSPSNQELSLG